MIRLLHTADLQIGKTFHWAEERNRSLLRENRLKSIDAILKIATTPDRRADVVLIAGDFFDSNSVDDRDVVQACLRLERFPCPVVIIPGNHDNGGPDSVFRRQRWLRSCPEGVIVALDTAPRVLLDGRLVVLPAPLLQRHETGAVTDAWSAEDAAHHTGATRIGLAHGSIHGFDSETDLRNEVDLDVIDRARLDYLAIGDWHGTLATPNPRAWYSGTPEPDRFKDNNSGNLLLIEIDAPGAMPRVETIDVRQSHWVRHTVDLSGPEDVRMVQSWFEALPPDSLVRLEHSGTLSLTDLGEYEQVLADARGKLLHLRLRGPGIVPEPNEDELLAIATEGYVKTAIDRLFAASHTSESTVEADALRLLHRLHLQTHR